MNYNAYVGVRRRFTGPHAKTRWRSREDRPARRDYAGSIVAGGRADKGLGPRLRARSHARSDPRPRGRQQGREASPATHSGVLAAIRPPIHWRSGSELTACGLATRHSSIRRNRSPFRPFNAMDQAVERKAAIEAQITALLPNWSLGPVVTALQAPRGVALAVATGVMAEIGDIRRFDNPRQLMAYLGLVPGERSSGEKRRLTSITKAGSIVARKLIVEAAWAYRMPAKVGQGMQRRHEGLPGEIRSTAWKAQVRLCARYR